MVFVGKTPIRDGDIRDHCQPAPRRALNERGFHQPPTTRSLLQGLQFGNPLLGKWIGFAKVDDPNMAVEISERVSAWKYNNTI